MKRYASEQFARVRGLPGAATQRVETLIFLARSLFYQSVIIFLTSGLLFGIAVFIYGSFYFAFVPSPIHQGPVHLIFEPCQEKMAKCGFLNASLSLSERNPVLMTGQQYTLTLSLEMPESDVNKHLGMFMNCVQLLSNDRKLVRSACRSSMLKYRSESLRALERYFIWPFLLTGYTDEKQHVHVPLLDDFLDDPLHPATRLDFQVMSRHAEVYTASYRIDAKFSGLRYLMFHYPITAAIFGTSLNMFILAAILILSWYRFFANTSGQMEEEDEDFNDPFEAEDAAKESSQTDYEGEEYYEEEEEIEDENVLGENIEKLQESSISDEDLDILPEISEAKKLE